MLMRKIIRPRQLKGVTGLSPATIARLRNLSTSDPKRFPEPIQLSANTIGFFEDEIEKWLEARAAER